jgi:hypothetical protein
LRFDDPSRLLRARVVDHVDAPALGVDAPDHVDDMAGNSEAWDHDRDSNAERVPRRPLLLGYDEIVGSRLQMQSPQCTR